MKTFKHPAAVKHDVIQKRNIFNMQILVMQYVKNDVPRVIKKIKKEQQF